MGSHTPSIITRASLRLAFLLLAPQGWSQWLTIASPNNFNIWLQSLFASQFTRSAPILCFKRNFVLYIASWICQPQIMLVTFTVLEGLPMPSRRDPSGTYQDTGWLVFGRYLLLYLTVPLAIRLQPVNLFVKVIISHQTI